MTSVIFHQSVLVLLLVFTAVTPSSGAPFDFSFGISPLIVAPPGQTTLIPAAIVNRLSTPLVFSPFVFGVRTDCPFFGCSGSGYGASAGPHGGLNLEFLDPRADLFHAQFVDVVIQPGARFDFSFVTVSPDPVGSRFNPTGSTPLQFGFSMFRDEVRIDALVITGAPTFSAPFEFAQSQGPPAFFPSPTPPAVVPEPATLLLVGSGAAAVGLARWRQRRRKQVGP